MFRFGTKKYIGVVRGGPSPDYDLSLKTGQRILSLDVPGYEWKDILIDKYGVWHLEGLAQKPALVLDKVDGVFNALHGSYGEDGGIQEVLDIFGVPYTGSGRVASALAMRKDLTLKRSAEQGIKIPMSLLIREGDAYDDVVIFFEKLSTPLVVKPASSGSSIGVSIASSEEELKSAIKEAFNYSPAVMVEEYIEGKEATCGVIQNFRNRKYYPLFPVEIIPHLSNFFDNKEKREGKIFERCPGNFSADEKLLLQETAILVHKTLGLSQYSRMDFVVNPKEGIFLLEANSLPELTEKSLFSIELKSSGIFMEQFIKSILDDMFAKRLC